MSEWVVQAVVVKVHDGDTITVEADLVKRDEDLGWHTRNQQRISSVIHVRILHINAPELSTPEGKTAQKAASTLLPPGTIVTLTSHALDKYGRSLGTLTLPDGTDYGTWMLEHGYAVPYEGGTRLSDSS
jgi:endonuclease YncB( thermonuclease family)